MARKKSKPLDAAYVLYDAFYEDGSRRSNRRVPTEVVNGLDGEEGIRRALAEQDNEIAEKSGKAPLAIDRIVRSDR